MVIWKSVSASRYQQQDCKTFLFALRFFLRKKTNVYVKCISIFFLGLSLSELISFCDDYSFLCDFLFIHLDAFFGVKLPIKTSMAKFFLSTLAGLPWSFSKTFLGQKYLLLL